MNPVNLTPTQVRNCCALYCFYIIITISYKICSVLTKSIHVGTHSLLPVLVLELADSKRMRKHLIQHSFVARFQHPRSKKAKANSDLVELKEITSFNNTRNDVYLLLPYMH